jgi:hypothetical protein
MVEAPIPRFCDPPMARRIRPALAILLCLATWPAQLAHAADRGPALNWVRLPGAESCVAPVELTELVERRLGRAVFVRARDAIVVIEGRVEPSPPLGFSVVLQVSDPDGTLYGTREITLPDADCRKLDQIVSLVVAVTIRRGSAGGIALPVSVARELDRLFEDDSSELDPASLPDSPGGAANPPPMAAGSRADGAGPTTTLAARDSDAGTPERRSDESVSLNGSAGGLPSDRSGSATGTSELGATPSGARWDVSAGVAFVSGLQPGFTFGPTIAGRFALATVGSLGLALTAGLPEDQTLGGGESGTLEYRVFAARLAVCAPSWWVGASELAACVAGGVGNVHVRAREFRARNDSIDEIWAEVGAQLLGRAPLAGPSFVELSLAAPIRLRAPQFGYTSSLGRTESAFEMALVGLRVELALGVRF